MKAYTVTVWGNHVEELNQYGHAYYANNVTAVEIIAKNKKDAKLKIKSLGLSVLMIFE